MKNIKYQFLSLLAMFVLSSCEKVIDLHLGNKSGQIVIEGDISNVNGRQSVKLTTNVPFTNTNEYPPVRGATVLITDNTGNSFALSETSPGAYSIESLTGISGRTYTMDVTVTGKNYKASSTMPALVKLDSITSKIAELDKKNRIITIHYQDPGGIPNQYRLVMFVNDIQIKSVLAMNDDFNDGKYVHTDIQQDDIDIHSGDNIRVEMQCIDKTVYKYWLTLAQQQDNGAGGGVAPSDPPTNINPATLGYFSAHTTQTLSMIAR